MNNEEYMKGVQAGIERLNDSLDPSSGMDPDACIAHIEAGTGDPYGCRSTLHTYATIKALLAWFEERDLSVFKQWAFVSGKIRRAMYQVRPKGAYFTPVYLMPLLSDNHALIDWYSRFDYPFSTESGTLAATRIKNSKMDEYYHHNTWLALRGDWEQLEQRARAFLNDVPAKQAAYQADHRFHLALAQGNLEGMESALAELVEPKLMKRRRQEEGGYTQHFICTFAIVYAKIAWRHGFQVSIESPWVPKEWLPIAPLPKYEDAFAFMAESDDSMPVAHA